MIRILLTALLLLWAAAGHAQTLQDLLQEDPEAIADPSRRTVGETLDRLLDAAPEGLPLFLERWQAREVYRRESDGLFFYAAETEAGFDLFDVATEEPAGTAAPREVAPLRPNAGVRGVIGQALVAFQLTDPDPRRRMAALDAIAGDPSADQLGPLRESLAGEEDPGVLARKERLVDLLTASFSDDREARLAAIGDLAADISVEARATLARMTRSTLAVTADRSLTVEEPLVPGTAALPREEAYALLVAEGLAPPLVTPEEIRAALVAAIEGDAVAGAPVASLGTDAAREAAYDALPGVAPRVSEAEVDAALAAHLFHRSYAEPDAAVARAAEAALGSAQGRVAAYQAADILLDAVSLASIFFLAAIGLAITFGVMGVINMAHGEFIMMGAYTGFVVQSLVPGRTLSVLLALPAAFAVAFAAGVVLERLVIRHLAHRPLETLLATFGVSIALQQLTKNVFGTQARPFTAPDWLGGAWVVNDVLGIATIRIAIFALAALFLLLLLLVLNRTRLGLEVRAVMQNRGMAASMGIDPDRISWLTFGLGSGIAGIAGVAIGLYAQVTSEMGSNYIVQSFMTVVVGGVGNVWGTLAGAALIGGLQKGIEWLNPSNTLAAQTYMILFIVAFIQFRPRGIVAQKGRAAAA